MRARSRARRALVGAAALLASSSSAAFAAPRVITPAAAKLAFNALGAGGKAFPLVAVRVERDHVWASLCREGDPTRCFTLALADPTPGCAGTIAGPWCVTFPDGPAPDEARAPLLAALAALREAEIWRAPDAAEPRALPASGAVGSPTPPMKHPFALAVALVLSPLAAGVGLARVARRFARPLAAAPLLVALVALPMLHRVGAWDVLAAALLLGVGLAIGRARASRLGLALVASLVALASLELVARTLPPLAATFPPPEQARLVFEAAPGVEACAPLFPDAFPATFASRTQALHAGAPVVLHVGDSMVEGVGVAPEQAFSALLGRAQPGVDHVNAGFAGTSLDFELLVIRAWAPRLAPSRVVLYVFGYNDLSELDRPYPCCPGGALLDASAAARCASPGLPSARLELLAASPAPYAARVATSSSALARRAVIGLEQLGAALAQPARSGDRFERYAVLMRALAAELAARHVPLSVVYLPARASLEAAAPEATGDYALRGRVLELAKSVGAEAIDPWATLADAVRADGAARWYLPPPDIHFTPEGHRLLADWLGGGALGRQR